MKRGIFLILVFFISFISLIHAIDSDNDGLSDEYEIVNGLDHFTSNLWTDSDLDGLSDIDEYHFNTSPVNADTDNDGYTDMEEYEKGSDPLNEFSPKYVLIFKFIIPAILGVLIIFLIIYLFSLINPSNKKSPEPRTEKTVKKKISIFGLISTFFEFLLGPSISKARKRDRKIEKKKLSGMEDIALDSSKVLKKLEFDDVLETKYDSFIEEDKKVVFTPSSDDFGFQLKRILRDNKRKNKVSDILGYFDKEMDNEELTLLEEKKSKKEILDWYDKRKEMRNKIIDLAKEEKEQLETQKTKSSNESKIIKKNEPTIFDRIDLGKKEIDKVNVFDKLEDINKK